MVRVGKNFNIINLQPPCHGGWNSHHSLRLERTSEGHLVQPPLLKQAHLEQVVQDNVQMAFGYLQGRRLHSLFGQPMPVLSHPQSKRLFLDIQRKPPVFQLVCIAS